MLKEVKSKPMLCVSGGGKRTRKRAKTRRFLGGIGDGNGEFSIIWKWVFKN